MRWPWLQQIRSLLQFIIDNVHCLTGFSWWASIVIATTLIRSLLYPLSLNQLKATAQVTLLRSKLAAVYEEMKDKVFAFDSCLRLYKTGDKLEHVIQILLLMIDVARVNELYKENMPNAMPPPQMLLLLAGSSSFSHQRSRYGVTSYTPLMGSFLSAPIYFSLFAAVWNMAEKVPSFKDGGMMWFTDLSTADTTYILPVLTALTYLIGDKLGELGPEIYPSSDTAKFASRCIMLLLIAWTATLPKAVLCSWITYNLFPLVYMLVYVVVKILPAKALMKLAK